MNKPAISYQAVAASLPFTKPEEEQAEPFDAILVRRYVKPAISWLLGQDAAHETRDTQIANMALVQSRCWWGLGLCIEVLANAWSVPGFSDQERDELASVSVDLAELLLLKQEPSDGSWDSVTWDTSVIVRALLLFEKAIRQSKVRIRGHENLDRKIEESARKAVGWLVRQSLQRDNVRYAFGAEDVAQIIRVICTVAAERPSLFPSDLSSFNIHSAEELIQQLVEYLIDLRTLPKEGIGSQETRYIPWEAPFSAGHALLAFADAIAILPPNLHGRTLSALSTTIHAAEATQSGGRWGMPNETPLMLYGYIAAGEALRVYGDMLSLRPEVVFRAIRWLTDEKQRFSDGSIMHTTDYTLFFALALQAVVTSARNNAYLHFTVPQLYDFVLWHEQMRITQERAERVRMIELYHQQQQKHAHVVRAANAYGAMLRVCGSAAIVLVFTELSLLTGWGSLYLKDPSFTVAYATATASAVSLFIIATRRLRHQTD